MILDLRLPLFVITGTWNVAIFQPAWIAIYLFGAAKGSEVQFTEVLAEQAPMGVRQILYLGDIGISVSSRRVEIFMNGWDNEKVAAAETTAKRVIEALPHTPLQALGLNLTYLIPEPGDELVDLLKCQDDLNERFKIKATKLNDTIALEDDIDLNFARTIGDGAVMLEYNYHHNPLNLENHEALIDGSCERYLEHSGETNRDVYKLEDFKVETFQLRKI